MSPQSTYLANLRVSGSNYGPTTRDFGIQFHLRWEEFDATFYVGRRGNNRRPWGEFNVKLPPDFAAKSVLEAVLFLEQAAKKAGIESYKLGYVKRPLLLRPQDVSAQLFRYRHGHPFCHLSWPGEPDHDEIVEAQRAEEQEKLCRPIYHSPDEVRGEAQRRAEKEKLRRPHTPNCPVEELEELNMRSLPFVRVNDLARELGIQSKLILDAAPLVGIKHRVTHSSSLGQNESDKVRSYLRTHILLS